MALTYELGITSQTAIELKPEYDYKESQVQIKNVHRTRSGRLRTYTWADYKHFEFTARFVTAENAAIVNSWFDSNAELLFFITSDSTTEVHSVVITNPDSPFQQHIKPYRTYYQGKISLEEY